MTAQQFKVKPTSQEVDVLDPDTFKPLKKAGEMKPRNEYWLRRVLDKSVTEVKNTKVSKENT